MQEDQRLEFKPPVILLRKSVPLGNRYAMEQYVTVSSPSLTCPPQVHVAPLQAAPMLMYRRPSGPMPITFGPPSKGAIELSSTVGAGKGCKPHRPSKSGNLKKKLIFLSGKGVMISADCLTGSVEEEEGVNGRGIQLRCVAHLAGQDTVVCAIIA